MKQSNLLTQCPVLFTTVLLLGGWFALTGCLQAAEPQGAAQQAAVAPRSFATPEAAVQALQAASTNQDKAAMCEIFGPEFRKLITGDAVQDANHARKFAAAVAQGCKVVREEDNNITIEVGTNGWPMPIPLVQADGQWHFDTAAGKEEIINRHIGRNELHAIGVCRAFVAAQWRYASMNPDAGSGTKYAQQFKSTPGKKDGLYWPATTNGPASPFGPLVAEAHAAGYGGHKGAGPHPFHGYYFKILTRQGPQAPGGEMNYVSNGNLTGGFALVAYPECWDQSGVMTFIVNQNGRVFQHNFDDQTLQVVEAMQAYNPDTAWTLVQDAGLVSAVSEK